MIAGRLTSIGIPSILNYEAEKKTNGFLVFAHGSAAMTATPP